MLCMNRSATRRALRLFLLLILLPALGLSCRDATGPDKVRLYVIPGQLALVNEGETSIYSIAINADVLPLLDWIPRVCDECGRVEPGATRFMDFESIRRIKLDSGWFD